MKNLGKCIRTTWIAGLCLGLALAQAPGPPDAEGHWEGAILIPSQQLQVAVDLHRGPDDSWTGAIDIPAQGIEHFPLSDVTVDGPIVSFAMQGIPGDPTFKGKLSDDGLALSGGFQQSGASLPFHLTRGPGEEPEEPTEQIEGIPGEGLAGIWYGVLDAGPIQLRLVAKISETAGGDFTGTLDSIDQGASDLKITRIALEEESVRLELSDFEAVFEGDMNEDGSAIEGEWQQGGRTLPLDFHRQEKAPQTARSQDPAPPYPYQAVDVSYGSAGGDVKLAGTLTLPPSPEPVPALLLISGSGPQDRNGAIMGHRPFLVLADYLTRRGIAVLRVDDRGTGQSTGSLSAATTKDFAADALTGVEFLKSRPEIDPQRVGLGGHSEGALVAALAASQSPDVAFLVLLASPGLTGEQLLYLQSASLIRAMGLDQELAEENRKIQERMFAIVKQEKDDQAAAKKLAELQAERFAELTPEQKKAMGIADDSVIASQAKILLAPWFRFFLTYDPLPALRKVRAPVLAITGERDLQVPPKQNMPPIEEALKAAGNGDYELVELPRLNHLLQTSKTGLPAEYARIEETIAPEALQRIAAWIDSHGKKAAAARP